jgi:hypothetical protein
MNINNLNIKYNRLVIMQRETQAISKRLMLLANQLLYDVKKANKEEVIKR